MLKETWKRQKGLEKCCWKDGIFEKTNLRKELENKVRLFL
jgi:hypothetical protein